MLRTVIHAIIPRYKYRIVRIFLLAHYCPYKYYIGLVTLNSTDKQSNLEMSSLLMLPMFHTIGVIQD